MLTADHYRIGTGEVVKINFGLFNKVKILYSGMPNDQTFALTIYRNDGYVGYSPVIYYSKNSRLIRIMEYQFNVVSVDVDGIVLLPKK